MRRPALAAISLATAVLAIATMPAAAMTITARVSGGNIPVHAGPHDRYQVIGRVADGTEIPIDECTGIDSDSRFGTLGDAGYPLWGRNATQWCHVPDTGWVQRDYLVGRGLVNVTPPDFDGPGW